MLVVTQKLVAPWGFGLNSIVFIHEPIMSRMKNANISGNFLRIFQHLSWASICSLVEIHNNKDKSDLELVLAVCVCVCVCV